MKKQILIILCLLCFTTAYTRTSKLVDKQILKEIKKEFKDSTNQKISQVTLETEDDGFSYYVCRRKDGDELLLISLDRDIIADVARVMFQYVPSREEGWHTYPYYSTKTGKIWTSRSNRCFILEENNRYKILNEDGSIRFKSNDGDGYLYNLRGLPNKDNIYYLDISRYEKSKSFLDAKHGLFTLDGKEIVPMEYDGISYESYNSDVFPFCVVWKEIDKTNDAKLYGGRYLDPENHAKYGVIPCEFKYVSQDYKTNQPSVRLHDYDEDEIYDPQKQYITTSRDLGEQYYKQQDFDNVIKYYASAGIEKPWARFYSGLAWYQKAYDIYGKVLSAHQWAVHNNDLNTAINVLSLAEPVIDLDLANRGAVSAKQLLESYRNSGDTEFTEQVETYLYRCNDLIKDHPNRKEEYKVVLDLIRQRNQAIAAEQEAQRQRQAAIWGAVLTGFVDALGSIIEHSVSTAATPTYHSYSVPTSTSSSSSSSSYSSSSSSTSSSSVSSSEEPTYQSIGSVSALKIGTGYGVVSTNSASIELYKYKVTGKIYAKIGGQYILIHDNRQYEFLEHNVSSYSKAVTYGNTTYFFNL